MRSLSTLLLVLMVLSCDFTKKSTITEKPDFAGRWIHTHLATESGSDTSLSDPKYNLAVFTDSTYYLTCSSPFWHTSGNIIAKQDTLILYKNDITSRDFSFLYELEENTLSLSPINEGHQNNIELLGQWIRD